MAEKKVRVWLTKMSFLKSAKEQPPNDITHDETHDHANDVTRDQQENGNSLGNGTSLTSVDSEDTDKTCWGKLKRFLKRIYKVSSSLVGLIIILIGYSFLGAWLFMLIESKHEQTFKQDISLTRNAIITELVTTSVTSRTRLTTEEKLKQLLIGYEADIMEAYKAGVTSSSIKEVWGFWDSLVFCGTVYSTIGYGHIAPVTDLGRGLCMLYAAIGIPLALLVLAEVGKRFTVFVKFLWAYVRRFYYTGSWRKIRKPFKKIYNVKDDAELGHKRKESEINVSLDDSEADTDSKGSKNLVHGYEVDENFNLPITVAIVILLIYILLGAFMYTWWEDWSYLESFYFVFISISTIGFGDVLPAHPKFFILSSVYIFIGLSLVSMCINVAIEFFAATADRAKAKMGEAKKQIGKKYTEARDKVQQVGQDIRSNIRDETDRIKRYGDEKFDKIGEKMSGAKGRVQQAGKDFRSNINETGDRIRQFKEEQLRKLGKSRSRSNTPTPAEAENVTDRKFSLPEDVQRRVNNPVIPTLKSSKSSSNLC